jgi:hypothetical protein
MQYLLTEAEMAALRGTKLPGGSISDHLKSLKNVCQNIACTHNTPLNSSPHGCIHVDDPRGSAWQPRCCDGCSVAEICPQPKLWSK